MKNTRKLNTDKYLAKEQFNALNKQFYGKYIEEFYNIKLKSLLNMISRTTEYNKSIENAEIELGNLTCTFENKDEEELKKYAKLELASTYFHCLETFIRLFIAHSSLSECPWIELSRLNIRKYRDALEKLGKGKFDWLNSEMSTIETINYTMAGFRDLPEGISLDDINGIKEWIIWTSNELMQNYEYNTFKHGLAIYTNEVGVKFTSNNELKLNKHGECLEFLARREKENRYVWVKKTVFISYDKRATIIYIISELIKNIISVGRFHYLGMEGKLNLLPTAKATPSFIFASSKTEIPGISARVNGFEEELMYYKKKI